MAPKSTQKPNSLPIIDISPWIDGQNEHERLSVATALHSACLEYGFFYLDISKLVDPSEPEELTRLAREFFALPQDEKDKIAIENQDYARGQFILRLSPFNLTDESPNGCRLCKIERKCNKWESR